MKGVEDEGRNGGGQTASKILLPVFPSPHPSSLGYEAVILSGTVMCIDLGTLYAS